MEILMTKIVLHPGFIIGLIASLIIIVIVSFLKKK